MKGRISKKARNDQICSDIMHLCYEKKFEQAAYYTFRVATTLSWPFAKYLVKDALILRKKVNPESRDSITKIINKKHTKKTSLI